MATYRKLLKNRKGDIIIPVADIDGFYATEDWVNEQLGNYYTKTEIASKVKTTTSTTAGDVYDVTYINTMLGNIETLLSEV